MFSFIRWLLHDMEQLAIADGYVTWREKEANDLENLVQNRFHSLQNPPDCDKAKKIVCNLNKVNKTFALFLFVEFSEKMKIKDLVNQMKLGNL